MKNPVFPEVEKSDIIDFSEIEHISDADIHTAVRRGSNGAHSLNIVNAVGNRKSIKLSKSLHDELNNLKSAQVAKKGTKLFIGEDLPGATRHYDFSKGVGTTIIYSAELVAWLTLKFDLDFSNGRTSRSFSKIDVVHPKDGSTAKPYAVIEMAG